MIYMHSNIEQQQNNTENLLCLITESCHIGPHKLGAEWPVSLLCHQGEGTQIYTCWSDQSDVVRFSN